MKRLTPSVLLTAALALSPFLAPALAQAPQPAAAPKTATLGGGSGGGGPLLTREELRACMKQQTELGTRRSTLEGQSQQLEQDKAAVLAEVDALKAERAKIDSTRASVADINARQSELSARIAQWNERVKVLNEGRRPPSGTQTQALERDRVALQAENDKLQAERNALPDMQESVNAFNGRAAAQEQKVVDWNARNKQLAEETEALTSDREQWTADCANRRYREDDEIAIERGE